MSHFKVIVITESSDVNVVTKALEPFQENNCDSCSPQYLKFYDVEEEYRQVWESGKTKVYTMLDGTFCSIHDKRWDSIPIFGIVGEVPPSDAIEKSFKEIYNSYDEFMLDWTGYQKDPRTNTHGYWENPNAKWDYWVIGGRWADTLKLKKNVKGYSNAIYCNQARIKDIDFPSMEAIARLKLDQSWELCHSGNHDKAESYFKYGISSDDNKDSYIRERSKFSSFAVLNNGKWTEKGYVKTFAGSAFTDEEWNNQLMDIILSVPDNYYLTVVDCHI